MKEKFMVPEGPQIEHKKSKDRLSSDFWPTYSAFANTKGGTIFLGVTEDKKETDLEKKWYVTGVSDPDKIKMELVTSLSSRDKVSHNVIQDEDIEVITYDSKKVIKVSVRECERNDKPVYLNNKLSETYIRKQSADIKVNASDLKKIIHDSKEILDTKVFTQYSLKDLNNISIQKYKSYLIGDNENSLYIDMPTHELMELLGVIKKDDKGQKGITAGGLLFFGKYQTILAEYPYFHLEYSVKIKNIIRWDDRVASGDPEYINLNIFMFYDIVMNKLKSQINNPFQLDSNQQRIMVGAKKEEALREGLANMLTHADYSMNNPISLTVYSTYYQFKNPGYMRIPIDKFFTTNETNVRNPIISSLFRAIRVGERAGTGGIELSHFAKTFRLKEPEIESDSESTTLKIWMVDLIEATSNLNDIEKNILAYLTKSKMVASRIEIQEALKIADKNKVLSALNSLLERKIIEKNGKGRGTTYSLPLTDEYVVGNLMHLVRLLSEKNEN